ncbi:MAG: replicative DNA helicase [Bacteroidota bacterium]
MDGAKQTPATAAKSRRIGLSSISESLGKLPPQAVEIEEAVLGALMLERDALSNVIDILHPESFYKEAHQDIYRCIVELFNDSQPIDIKTVAHQLRKAAKLELVGGAYYVAELTTKVNSAANIEYHARIIAEQSIKRELIRISSEIQKDAYEDTVDVFKLLDRAEQSLFDVSESHIRKNYDKMSSLLHQAIDEIQAKKDKQDGLTGVASGFSALDRVTSGWQPSDLVIIAARPGMGKCLGKGTKVVMYDGSLKKVEDVVVGDLLMGDDSSPRKVLSLARGREQMYHVHQNSGMTYRVNESHILSLKRSRNEGKHQQGDKLDICLRDYLSKSDKFKSNYKGYKVPVEFEEKQLTLHPYFLGVWLGDGHSYSSRITNVDEEVIDYLKGYAEELELAFVEYRQEGKTPSYGITKGARGQQNFYSIQGELRKLDLIENKHIPKNYLVNSSLNRLLLLAGLIDSDGYYDENYNVFEIVQKREGLAREIKFLCDSLGFKTSFRKKEVSIRGVNKGDVFRIRISGNIEVIPTKVKRKQARIRKSITDWRSTGISIAYDKVDDYYGFEIDGNRRFLLEDMTVTHNTAFVVSALRNAAIDHDSPAAIFSLEMSSIQLVNRLISAEAELESEKIKRGDLADYEWEQIIHKTDKLSQAPIFIDDTPGLSILELRAKCRRLVAQHGVKLVIIDYLQLMSGDSSGKSGGNREQEIAQISRALKGIAKELNVPVLALSQLSRAVETRGGDKRPQLSDLRESGSIEQDADMVMFLYRPEYYGLDTDESGMPLQGLGEVIIAKHRNGRTDTVNLKFIGKYTKFMDWDGDSGGDGFGAFPTSGNTNSEATIILPSKANDTQNQDDQPF